MFIRLCSLIEMLYGAHLHEIAQLVCTIVEVTKTQLYLMQEGRFRPISPEAEPEGKVPYHELFFPYGDIILLMLQMHYFHMATKLHMIITRNSTDNGGEEHYKLLMTREQVIAQAKRKFSSNNPYDLIYKLDMFEQHTTQLLHYISTPEDTHTNPPSSDILMKYVRTSCSLVIMLTQSRLLYMNMISVSDTSMLSKPLAITFLAALAEGYYVYHAHPEKCLFKKSVQSEAIKRWIASQKGKKQVDATVTMAPKAAITPSSVTSIPLSTPSSPPPSPSPSPSSSPLPSPSPSPPPPKVTSPQPPTSARIVNRPKIMNKKKRSKDVDTIKTIQRAKAAAALEKAREADTKKKTIIKAAAARAVEMIEAKLKKEEEEKEEEAIFTPYYLDDEPHMWCTWNECLCHKLRRQI